MGQNQGREAHGETTGEGGYPAALASLGGPGNHGPGDAAGGGRTSTSGAADGGRRVSSSAAAAAIASAGGGGNGGSRHHVPSSSSASGLGGLLGSSPSASATSATAAPPTLPGGLAVLKSFPKTFDDGALEPQGVYTGAQDYAHEVVKTLIVARRLAPFYKGADDDDTYAHAFGGEVEQAECPICFLNYPSPLNATRCCEQPICTECFVQIRRADPNATNPPSSQPAACPYCQADHFGVVYHPPPALLQGCRLKGGFEKRSAGGLFGHRKTPSGGGSGSGGVGGSALDSGFSIPATGRNSHAAGEEEPRAERDELPTPADMAAAAAAGESLPASTTADAAAGTTHRRRKSFGHLDPEVVTVDAVRPDWSAKLAAAQATIARRANRRLIMRQVGERLIPVGISSSRLGQELPMGTGPGGAIILQEGESLVLPPGFETTGVGSGAGAGAAAGSSGGRRRSSGRALFGLVGAGGDEEESAARRESRRQGELARYLIRQGNAQDVEDAMMEEAMRLSLLEHEEQQRKQQAEERAKQAAAAAAAQSGTSAGGSGSGSGSGSALQTPLTPVRRTSATGTASATAAVTPATASATGTGTGGATSLAQENSQLGSGARVSMIGGNSSSLQRDLAEALGSTGNTSTGGGASGSGSGAGATRANSSGTSKAPPPAPLPLPDPVDALNAPSSASSTTSAASPGHKRNQLSTSSTTSTGSARRPPGGGSEQQATRSSGEASPKRMSFDKVASKLPKKAQAFLHHGHAPGHAHAHANSSGAGHSHSHSSSSAIGTGSSAGNRSPPASATLPSATTTGATSSSADAHSPSSPRGPAVGTLITPTDESAPSAAPPKTAAAISSSGGGAGNPTSRDSNSASAAAHASSSIPPSSSTGSTGSTFPTLSRIDTSNTFASTTAGDSDSGHAGYMQLADD